MHPEEYNFTWHSYPDYLREVMREMMTSEDFTDVTLVTDDKKTIKAHRNILSACSPVFKNILQMEITNSHPVIYLKGIQSSEMESILQFIYLGEANFYEERMNDFLSVSKNLEIRELSKYVERDQADLSVVHDITDLSNQNQKDSVSDDHDHSTEEQEEVSSTNESESQKEKDIKSKEICGTNIQCPQCDKFFSNNSNLHKHIRTVHEGVKYACNECDFQATQQGHLRTHIQSVHEGVRYSCNQCDYQATKQSNLTQHIESKHEGVKYGCNKCDFQATQQGHLKTHIQSVHEGVKYPCNQCDYQATEKGSLTKHFKRKHS